MPEEGTTTESGDSYPSCGNTVSLPLLFFFVFHFFHFFFLTDVPSRLFGTLMGNF